MLSNIAETSTNEKSLEKEDEKSDAKGQIAMINSLNEKFPFKKLRRILVNPQFLNIRNMAPRANLKSKWNKSKNK